MEFFLPFAWQNGTNSIPEPTDSTVYLVQEQQRMVGVRQFGGFAPQDKVVKEAAALASDLTNAGYIYDKSFYIYAG